MISDEFQRTINGADLGAIPTDFELATIYGYTPVHSGWIYGHRHGGLGDTDMPPTDSLEINRRMLANQDRQVLLQTLSTVALISVAAISIWKVVTGKGF